MDTCYGHVHGVFSWVSWKSLQNFPDFCAIAMLGFRESCCNKENSNLREMQFCCWEVYSAHLIWHKFHEKNEATHDKCIPNPVFRMGYRCSCPRIHSGVAAEQVEILAGRLRATGDTWHRPIKTRSCCLGWMTVGRALFFSRNFVKFQGFLKVTCTLCRFVWTISFSSFIGVCPFSWNSYVFCSGVLFRCCLFEE